MVPNTQTMVNGQLYPCCQRADNREVIEHVPGHVKVERCRECGRRHFRAFVKLPKIAVSLD